MYQRPKSCAWRSFSSSAVCAFGAAIMALGASDTGVGGILGLASFDGRAVTIDLA
jgi:hypothetical protein